jgi:hypothetical protein
MLAIKLQNRYVGERLAMKPTLGSGRQRTTSNKIDYNSVRML